MLVFQLEENLGYFVVAESVKASLLSADNISELGFTPLNLWIFMNLAKRLKKKLVQNLLQN
jgi:hypothetical protein